ncbi:MAG: HAD-IA family hydrolase [Candidatus Latescibacteria bacterium]|nr:HAD-IA family hydrolase [Candidatus Latescibacterota bacterium]NIM22602.1 HAD-IA family hydrolase [Candidatus Latescibacterota bacterium]NIM64891.1 HAD-IA family hydrolase [Candidatus Latescibacterota bacterium]NIO01406.1 HAD-IA family hydrolase [Candidatus Latescibacterota bacterium]NIO27916.1 HAD-IA family hydrolase [Candidatus Latescibacterota bacterium]
MIKVAIFDLDNTLTDFKGMKENAVDAAVEAMIDAGLLFPPNEIKQKVYEVYEKKGIEFQHVFDVVLEELLGEVNYKIQAAGIVAYRRAREASLVLYPHVRVALIGLMKRNIRLAVVSDAPRKEAWLRLCYLQLHHIFDFVLTYDDTKAMKPSPIPFRRVLHHFQVKPDEAIMVGDWPDRDITGAAQVGIITVFARYGDTFGTKESGAHYDIDDIVELLDIVDELNKSSGSIGKH